MFNIQGLIGKSFNKLDSEELKDMFCKNDILLFTESWSNEQFNYEVPQFKHFILHRQNKSVNRAKRDSGGIVIYVHVGVGTGSSEPDRTGSLI